MSQFVQATKNALNTNHRGLDKKKTIIAKRHLDELFRHWERLDVDMRTDYYKMESLKDELHQKAKYISELERKLNTAEAALRSCYNASGGALNLKTSERQK